MIQIGLSLLDQAHVDIAAQNIQRLLGDLKLSDISFEEFMVASLDPTNICNQVMDLNVSQIVNENVIVNWDIPHEKSIRYLIDSISMLIYNRLSNSNSGVRRLWTEVFLLEAFKYHPAQLAIIAAPHHTPYSLIVGEQYSYWEPMEEDTFFIVDESVNINDLVEQEESKQLQSFVEIFNTWEPLERELVVRMLNKALRCKTLLGLLTTIRDSICLKWMQGTLKHKVEFKSHNLVFAIAFTTIKNII